MDSLKRNSEKSIRISKSRYKKEKEKKEYPIALWSAN